MKRCKNWLGEQLGFSLLELMIVVAIIGILARLSIPRYRSFVAEARRAEAQVNLRAIHTHQEAYMVANNVYWGPSSGTPLANKYGYDSTTTWNCNAEPGTSAVSAGLASGKKLGFKFKSEKECQESRYGYIVQANEGDYVALAHGGHDESNWLFEQCKGIGAGVAVDVSNCASADAAARTGLAAPTIAAQANGDSLCIGSERPLQVIKDLIEDCK